MTTLREIASCLFFFLLTSGVGTTVAQTNPETEWPGATPPIPILITRTVNESELVTLPGNTRPEANATNDQGRLADSFPLEHMILLLRRSRVQEQALTGLIDRLLDPTSPYFHHWLTPHELGARYGLAQKDIHTITRWLKSHGFSVNTVYPNQFVIDFSGIGGSSTSSISHGDPSAQSGRYGTYREHDRPADPSCARPCGRRGGLAK